MIIPIDASLKQSILSTIQENTLQGSRFTASKNYKNHVPKKELYDSRKPPEENASLWKEKRLATKPTLDPKLGERLKKANDKNETDMQIAEIKSQTKLQQETIRQQG